MMMQMKSVVRFCRCISYFLFLSRLMCFCGIVFYSSVCGSLGCCWFTVLRDVSLESLLREGEMFLKTFIINQKKPSARDAIFIFEIQWLILIATSARCARHVSVLSLDTVDRQVFCPLLVLCPVSPPLYHSSRRKWEGLKTGTDNMSFMRLKVNSGGLLHRSGPLLRAEGERTERLKRKCVTGLIWLEGSCGWIVLLSFWQTQESPGGMCTNHGH